MTRMAPPAGVLSILLWAAVPVQAEDLRVCLLEDDLPRAHRANASGFDHDLFREAANRLGRNFVPVWRPNAPPYSEIDDTDLPFDELLDGVCDLVPSVPGQLALGRLAAAIDLSPPYYAAAFEIYMPPMDRLEWTALPEVAAGHRVAVRLQSLGHFAAEWAGLDWTSLPTAADVAAAVDDGRATAALIWGPALGRLQKEPVRVFEPPPGLRFNEHAAMRSGDSLAPEIEQMLEELRRDGTLQRLADRYGIFRTEPFPTVSSPAAIRALGEGAQ
ncbi:MAG: transporter substrate-binding domain-containing protein [Acidobacteria bacterium]|nr:transporter substrate-binding domain-containing protein [Acidobacteriota bacterium]